jgi:hypothetical protein
MGNDQPALRALFACESGPFQNRKSGWNNRFEIALNFAKQFVVSGVASPTI